MTRRNHIDIVLLLAVLTLLFLSLGIVYSASAIWASNSGRETEYFLGQQAIRVAGSIVCLFVGMMINYHRWKKLTKAALIISTFLLFLTLLIGSEAQGAERWLRVGPVNIQPSEFAKYALVFHLAALLSTKGDQIRDLKRGFFPMMFWIGVVCALVILEPNFSMGVVIFLLGMLMVFLGGARFKHIFRTALMLLPVLIAVMVSMSYRIKRMSFIYLWTGEFEKVNGQLLQGIIALGNGGPFGLGPGESKARELFLWGSHTDFIFPIIGEEYGILGALFFLLIYVLIMYRGFRIASHAVDPFGRYVALGITSTITLYALVNIGVTLGLLPTTGVPMPFVSFGGSAMIFSAGAVGVLLNISAQTDLNPREQKIPVVGTVNADEASIGQVY